ncbi:hypothetical protein F1559_002405 [Cyanidiococcus yangmingshanensis]|uniref:CRC domain-containing protein n=1 Tax=Cyanidiococcus yangmingshanensis TaxID=2690220 RepID=A0A7J7IGS9_9RHOD|nr:hypothetical protein F1559_002405 [Cyanidiococcus yangmingshanensis]
MTPLTARLREQSQVAADLDPDFAQVALATNDQRLRIKRYQQLYGPVSSPLASSRAVSQASRARTIEPVHAPMSTAVPGMNPQPLCATHPASQSAAERWTTFAPLEQRIEAPQPSIPLGVAQSSRDPGRATPAATIAGMYYRFEHQTLFDSGGVNDTDPEDHSDNLGGIDENSGLASPLVASTRPSCARMHLARLGTHSQRMPLVDAADELNRFELGSVHVLNERHVPNHAYAAVVDAHGPFWNSDPLQEATSPLRKRLRPDAAALSGTAHVHPGTDGKVPNLFRVSIQNGEPVFITESELSASDAALPGAGHPHTMSRLVQRPAKQGRLENKRVAFADHALDADTGSTHSVLTNAYGGTKAKSRKQRVPRHVPLDASAVSTVNESSMTASCLGQSSFLSPCGPLPHTGASATASLSSKRDNQWQEIGRVPTRHDANPYGFELLPGHRLHEPAGYATEASTHAMVSLDGCPADESTDCYTTTEDGGITTLAVDPVTAAELQRASRRLQTPRTHPTRTTAKRCRCRRSRCLKKYCDCFAAGHFCGPECECENCGNHEENRSEVEQARQSASQRSSTNGDGVVGETSLTDRVSLRGCRCKRTGCLKRYCECFQTGRECTVHCACEGCINCRGLSEHLLVEIRKRLA